MAKIPASQTIVGRYIKLDPMVPETDASRLYRLSHDDERSRQIFAYLQRGPFSDVAEMTTFYRDWCATSGVWAYVVRDAKQETAHAKDDQTLGTISLMHTVPEHGVVEIGNVWYSPAVQRTKTNTESVYLLLRYCFEELGYRRIEWKCDTRNRPSGTAALRLGFTFEGIFRKHMIIRGANRDSAWFSMLDDEWPIRRSALETWLYHDDSIPLSEVNRATLPY